MRFFLLVLKNLRRNRLRSLLTALAVVALVAVLSLITNFVSFFDDFTSEKSKDVKVIINERFRVFSSFDRRHVDDIISSHTELGQELRQIPGFDPEKYTVWHFVGFTLDPEQKDKDKMFFVVGTIPEKIATMTDGLDPGDCDPSWLELMRHPPRSRLENSGLVMGASILAKLKLQLGDRIKAKSLTHLEGKGLRKPIEMEFEIIGVIPDKSRWNDAAFMDCVYLDRVLKEAQNEYDGKVSYAWLQLPDRQTAEQVSLTIERHRRELRCETAAAAWSRFVEPLKPMLWAIKWPLRIAIVIVMVIILTNTFVITVRERRTEVAVLKVLGFPAGHILAMVLGEAVLVGALAGALGALVTFAAVNWAVGGIVLGGMPVMYMPGLIFCWGPVIGGLTALVGGVLPAWIANRVRVSDVFASTA